MLSNKARNVSIVAAVFLIASAICSTWLFNYLALERPLQRALGSDPRNRVVNAKPHFGHWVNRSTLVFDLASVSDKASPLDVFRAFLVYAQVLKDRRFRTVILSSRGKSKFTLDGGYFQWLGEEYGTQNPIYTIRTFPIHLSAIDGTKPFSEYEGGLLGVLQKEMEQFNEFSERWYVRDFVESRTKGAALNSQAEFDPCEGLRQTDPHCGWKAHWEDSGVSTNAIDGTKTEFLSLESSDADGVDFGRMHFAELRICFANGKLCGSPRVAVGVTVHGMLEPVSYESQYRTSIRLKFDDDKPLRQTWGIADSHEALFPDGQEKQFLGQLISHNKLVLEFSYYEKAARTVTFELPGLADKMKSANLTN
jgi:hypothetical protein